MSAAWGATITQTQPYSGTPGFFTDLTLNKFDTQGGLYYLNSIQILLSLQSVGGTFILDNDGDSQATGTLGFGATANLTSSDVTLLSTTLQPIFPSPLMAAGTQNFSLDPNVGDGSGDYDPSPPDGLQYTGGTVTDSNSAYVHSLVWSGYQGTGTYKIRVTANQYSNFGGIGGIEYAVTPVTASGQLTVIYDYGVIPEPGTLALLGFGLVGLGIVIKRRRSS